MFRNCIILNSVIIHEKYIGCGFGNILMNYAMFNIVKKNGFLLCEKQNITFYEKYEWLQSNDIDIKNKIVTSNLCSIVYNFSLDNVIY